MFGSNLLILEMNGLWNNDKTANFNWELYKIYELISLKLFDKAVISPKYFSMKSIKFKINKN